jgi:hypothetical protein
VGSFQGRAAGGRHIDGILEDLVFVLDLDSVAQGILATFDALAALGGLFGEVQVSACIVTIHQGAVVDMLDFNLSQLTRHVACFLSQLPE